MSALDHVLGGWAMMVAAWWVNGYPHDDDDGIDVPLRRLNERSTWMYRSDPGLNVQLQGETSLPPALAANAGEAEVVLGARPASPALQGHPR